MRSGPFRSRLPSFTKVAYATAIFTIPILAFALLAGDWAHAGESPPSTQVVAHRGHHTLAPENTIPAIESAINIGCDFVEIDVRTTSDGKLVLLHDSTVDRTTSGKGKISEITFAEARQLDAGSYRGKLWSGQLIPTFAEALEACQGKIGIYLDHKEADVEQVVTELVKYEMVKQTIVYCGSTDVLRRYKELAPDIRIMTGHPGTEEEIRELLRDLKPETLDGNLRDWTSPQALLARKLGAELWIDCLGDTDTPENWQRAIELGATGIQTDHPVKLLKFLQRRNQ